MKIGTFRIRSAKKIRKFLLTRSCGTNNEILKEASHDEKEINRVQGIDMNTVLRNYQELSFRS
jgi:hypothetical protein